MTNFAKGKIFLNFLKYKMSTHWMSFLLKMNRRRQSWRRRSLQRRTEKVSMQIIGFKAFYSPLIHTIYTHSSLGGCFYVRCCQPHWKQTRIKCLAQVHNDRLGWSSIWTNNLLYPLSLWCPDFKLFHSRPVMAASLRTYTV